MTVPHASILRHARSPRGARACFGLLLVSAALLIAPVLARAARKPDDSERLPLPWRVEGRTGFTVDAVGFPDSAGTLLEVYVRIPPSTLESLARDGAGGGLLEVTTRLRLPTGARLPDRREEIPFAAADTAGGFGKVVVLRFPTRPGTHRLEVRIADAQSHKVGLAYVGREAHESASVRGVFDLPRPEAGREMSDLEFVWAQPDSGAGIFRHAGFTLLPNPERLFGLYSGDLRAYFCARSRDGDERRWHWVARVLDDSGRAVAAQESTSVAGRLDAVCALDVSTHAAGGYDLEVKAWQEGDSVALVRRSRFSIAWKPASWTRDPLEVSDDVHLLLESEEEERFAALHPGERERVLDEFWKRRDPTPETGENEALEIFRARVAKANELYGVKGRLRGMFTDMGRTYIRYGEPSEISHQVIPTGDETVQHVLHELEASEDRASTTNTSTQATGNDQRPFEVWIYEAPVPAPIEADPKRQAPRHKRLVFVFVDEQGLGQFTLRYSTE
jgi:GWxTD domain-containing protein